MRLVKYHYLSHGKDGYALHVGNKKLWSTALARGAEKIDALIGHRWCNGLRSDFFWNHSPLLRKGPHDGYYPASINNHIVDSFGWITHFEWRGEKEIYSAPLTIEQARRIDADFVESCEDMLDQHQK